MPKKKTVSRFALVEKEILYSHSWASLTDSAKVVYVHLKGEFDGSNGDRLKLPYSHMKRIMGNATYWRGIKSLIEAGFIEMVFHGGRAERGIGGYEKKQPNVYKIFHSWRLREKTLAEYQDEWQKKQARKEYRSQIDT